MLTSHVVVSEGLPVGINNRLHPINGAFCFNQQFNVVVNKHQTYRVVGGHKHDFSSSLRPCEVEAQANGCAACPGPLVHNLGGYELTYHLYGKICPPEGWMDEPPSTVC